MIASPPELLERLRQRIPTDEDVRASWPWLATAIELGWLDRGELGELIEHLRSHRDFGIEELQFAHIGDCLRVSFRDDNCQCSPAAMLAALTTLMSDRPDAHDATTA